MFSIYFDSIWHFMITRNHNNKRTRPTTRTPVIIHTDLIMRRTERTQYWATTTGHLKQIMKTENLATTCTTGWNNVHKCAGVNL